MEVTDITSDMIEKLKKLNINSVYQLAVQISISNILGVLNLITNNNNLQSNNVILFTSGEECIEKFVEEKNQGNEIHLMLLDYKLGDMFGDSVARKIKELNGPRIILISAIELNHALLKELEDGDYITKHVEKLIQANQLIELVADTIC